MVPTVIRVTLMVSAMVCVALLAHETHSLRRSVDLLVEAMAVSQRGAEERASAIRETSTTPAAGGIDPELLSTIIAQALDERLRTAEAGNGPEVSADERTYARPTEHEERVTQDIEYHISVGSISELEMQRLQSKISRLDEQARKRALRRLVSAMNDGSIKGRL